VTALAKWQHHDIDFVLDGRALMKGIDMNWRLAFAVVVSILLSCSASLADAEFTYMLPRTVLDTTIVYTFDSCANSPTGAQLKIKIAPTIVSRAIPDLHVGPRKINPADLTSWTQDRSISLKTFAVTHILNSIGSQPSSQIGTIVSNVLGGVTKLVAVGLGVVAADATPGLPKSKCGGAQDIADNISKAQKQIRALQAALADTNSPPNEATQKSDLAEIQALQIQIANLQADLTHTTITIKKTIDPGFTPVDIGANKPDHATPVGIEKTGLIATFGLSKAQVEDAKWYDNFDNVSKDDKALLDVNMYLDFPKAYPSAVTTGAGNQYHQTSMAAGPEGGMFREAEYVPVLFWRGTRPSAPATDDITKPTQLSPPQTVVLAQYGVAQSLPTTAPPFQSLNWSVTFNDNGEVTDASFSTKAIGVGLTGAFGSLASAANSTATEVRSSASAASSETIRLTAENNALTQQVNNITLNQTLQGLRAKGLEPR
jgi:hypothetical protein